MAFIDKIQMRVDLHEVNRRLLRKRIDAGNIHRMVAAQHNGHSTSRQNGAHPGFNIGMTLQRIGMHNISITNINDANLIRLEIGHIIFMIISPGVTK